MLHTGYGLDAKESQEAEEDGGRATQYRLLSLSGIRLTVPCHQYKNDVFYIWVVGRAISLHYYAFLSCTRSQVQPQHLQLKGP